MTQDVRLQFARLVVMLAGFGLIKLRFDDSNVSVAWMSAWIINFVILLCR